MPMPSPLPIMEAVLPVIFFDGEQEVGIGDVVVIPGLNLKGLQAILAQRIGLSPHQFSVFLADRCRPGAKIPITGKTNFAAISRDGGMAASWAFLVVLKRSRRHSRSREFETRRRLLNSAPPENLTLLRRDGTDVAIDGSGFPFPGLDLGRSGYERRVRELRTEKERYQMDMGLGLGLDSGLGLGLNSGLDRLKTQPMEMAVVCEGCSRGGGNDDGFHLCARDAVTYGFKSPAGPIGPTRYE